MRQHRHTYGVGRAVAAAPTEADFQCWPRLWARDGSKPAILAAHGAGQVGLSGPGFPTAFPGQYAFYHQLSANLGCPLISHDNGGTSTWGNTTAQSRIGAVRTYAQGAAIGAKSGKVILCGVSMGGVNSLNYAKNNTANVAAIIIAIPVTDLDDIRDNNRGGYRSDISTAWGTGAWTAPGTPPLPAGANPATYPGDLDRVPVLAYSASDDPICTPATIAAVVALCSEGSVVRDVGALGHTDAAVAAAAADFTFQREWLKEVDAL